MAKPKGRPRGQWVPVPCKGCGAVEQRQPSRVPVGGKRLCMECRDKGVGSKPRSGVERTCSVCDAAFYVSPQRADTARFCSWKCHGVDQGRNQVENPCRWCGSPVKSAASRNLQFCTEEAPEPDCGWPDGVRMTCSQLGQFVNLDQPLRFVNGKPVRIWINRTRSDDRRAQVWDPESKDGEGAWVFEHRWNWEQRHGVKLTSDVHIHHVNGDKADNDPDHLEGLTPSAHARLHGAQTRALRDENARLKAELDALRSDPVFMDRLKANMEEHAPLLERLADG